MSTYHEVMLRVAVLKHISDYTQKQYDLARGEAAAMVTPGHRNRVASPLDGAPIGTVYMTDPKSSSVVTSEAALLEWMTAHYPEHVETGYRVSASDAELQSVLFVHAPHLLRQIRRVKRSVLAEIHKRSVAAGGPVGPGGEVDMPGVTIQTADAYVACLADVDQGLPSVIELFRAGRLDLDGKTRNEIAGEQA